jgi:hypothetical protein
MGFMDKIMAIFKPKKDEEAAAPEEPKTEETKSEEEKTEE